MAGIFDSLPAASTWISPVVRLRSFHGFTTRPPKPPVGNRIWKVCSYSGIERYTSSTCPPYSLTWSIVAFGGACRMPKTMLWSSFGASSCCENR